MFGTAEVEGVMVQVTTITVHPDRATALREIRDQRDLPNMDSALAEVVDSYSGGESV